MSTASLLFYLWAFIKEMFSKERLHDPYKETNPNSSFANKLVTTIQSSRPLIVILVLALFLSLFINYKFIKRVTAITREEMGVETSQSKGEAEPFKRPTIPKPPDDLNDYEEYGSEEVLEYLEKLYGVKK